MLFVVMSTPLRSVVKGAIVEFGDSDPVAVALSVEFDTSLDMFMMLRYLWAG